MSRSDKTAFEDLGLDDDVYYPVPVNGGALHKLPGEMNRHDRRTVLRIVEKSVQLNLVHPYKGRMGD
ncbi:hypothetical protein G6L37_05670 [Agrobacterium rubi]|nr:hypothetical protein [Agrobacterium rubi]NTF24847.1 hypothetical protein [Agrobacterium rubi]